MTVRELIEILKTMPQNAKVYVDNHQMHEYESATYVEMECGKDCVINS